MKKSLLTSIVCVFGVALLASCQNKSETTTTTPASSAPAKKSASFGPAGPGTARSKSLTQEKGKAPKSKKSAGPFPVSLAVSFGHTLVVSRVGCAADRVTQKLSCSFDLHRHPLGGGVSLYSPNRRVLRRRKLVGEEIEQRYCENRSSAVIHHTVLVPAGLIDDPNSFRTNSS